MPAILKSRMGRSGNKTMSSAYIRQLSSTSWSLTGVQRSSKIEGRSLRNMLNSNGLSMHPCFTPE